MFLDSILFKSAGISICYTDCSQGQYSNIILTLVYLIGKLVFSRLNQFTRFPRHLQKSRHLDQLQMQLMLLEPRRATWTFSSVPLELLSVFQLVLVLVEAFHTLSPSRIGKKCIYQLRSRIEMFQISFFRETKTEWKCREKPFQNCNEIFFIVYRITSNNSGTPKISEKSIKYL